MLKMDKEHVARALEEMSTLHEFHGENTFKVRAYLNAAHALRMIEEDFSKVLEDDRLKDYEGIGEKLAEKIKILATTGTHPIYEELKRSVPKGLFALMRVPGLGVKKIKVLYEKLKIANLEELKQACLAGRVAEIKGFGEKTEQNILKGLANLENYSKRYLWMEAHLAAQPLLTELRKLKGVEAADVAGSLRRCLETVGDLDFVAAAINPQPIMDWFVAYPSVDSVITHGPSKSSVRLHGGLQAELRIVPPSEYGYVLLYSTGSKSHNIRLRQCALDKELSLSEWGFTPDPFPKKGKTATEEAIYQVLGMEYVPPELREDMGEIEAALKKSLPRLIEEGDLRGTFHVHTAASDGRETLEGMVQAAQELGWEYVGITDHSKSSYQANGLSEERLLEQVKQIRALNKSKKYKIHVFAGLECDILPNGKLDFGEDVLEELDFVIASIHSSVHQEKKVITKRLIKAIEHPCTTMVGHVTGRLLLTREGGDVDVPKVIDACIANGKIMELNCNPHRMEMDWRLWHKAAERGLQCSINPDAHDPSNLQFVRLGVNLARKGWLSKDQVLNAQPLAKVKARLRRTQD